jgi:hypothetical protein
LSRDVNHDLIAAGHPRLNFELAAFLDNMPPHWKEKGQNADPTGRFPRAKNFSARAWAIGQLASARAALELLGARVETEKAPWPEFAEYGCFSCHHDLRDDAWRRQRPVGPARGAPSWGSWTMPLLRDLPKFIADPAAKRASESIDALSVLMAAAAPERAKIADHSRACTQTLVGLLDVLAAQPMDARDVETLLGIVNRREGWEAVSNWDEAAWRFLALVPLYQAKAALVPGEAPEIISLRRQIDALLGRLRFPPGFDSPSGFDPSLLPRGQ